MAENKTVLQLLSVDLDTIHQKIKAFPVSKQREFEAYLGDAANEIYDTYEYIIELVDEPNKNKNRQIKTEKEIEAFNKLSDGVTSLLNLLSDMDYDSNNMDRLKDFLGTMEEYFPNVNVK